MSDSAKEFVDDNRSCYDVETFQGLKSILSKMNMDQELIGFIEQDQLPMTDSTYNISGTDRDHLWIFYLLRLLEAISGISRPSGIARSRSRKRKKYDVNDLSEETNLRRSQELREMSRSAALRAHKCSDVRREDAAKEDARKGQKVVSPGAARS